MKTIAMLFVGFAFCACTAKFVQDAYVQDDVLVVRECILTNGQVFAKHDCSERRYKLK